MICKKHDKIVVMDTIDSKCEINGFKELDISPLIPAAIQMIENVENVYAVKLLSNLMYVYRGELGADININETKIFLSLDIALKIMLYDGDFVATKFVNKIIGN